MCNKRKTVILSKVTFTTSTASETTKAYGTTPDGTRYEFQDTYNAKPQPAGIYNVTCVVKYSKRGSTEYFFLAPIAYAESDLTGINEILTDSDEPVSYYNLQGVRVDNPYAGLIVIKRQGSAVTKIIVK